MTLNLADYIYLGSCGVILLVAGILTWKTWRDLR